MSLPAAFVSVILIWSTTPLAIKWSALGVGPSFAVFSRMAIGALLCVALLALLRVRIPLHRRARQAYLVSGISMFGAMALTYWSSKFVSSGMISVLFGLSPLMTSLGAALWLKEESLTNSKLAGMVLGVIGLLLVFRGGLDIGAEAGLGLAALLFAVLLQSLGLVWLKRIGDDSPPLATTLGSLVVALPLFFASWWLSDGHLPEDLPERAVAATVYLGAVGSVLGFALYYYMIKHMEAGRIALITLITPVLALLLGHGLNDEAVLPQVWLGTASILLGLGLHRWGDQWEQAVAKLLVK
ncbi:membrane protein [Ferrigenium kumadai]|uniref:Membrane protein n=1 Tax=Ferrigenium kumadai TaxID=1682490 RepID=A0AAN1SYS4_9PROT|nr:DMT family transporter [Ferrigenium kumadai]BBI98580.1 membrane protein [Ferrigenium kumadai]